MPPPPLAHLAALLAVAVGVASAARAQPDLFDHFGTADGLSQSTVTALAQDRAGFLWVGTDDGLNRFDGQAFVVYRHALEDPTTLPGSRVTSLAVATDGALWVGTMSGLARFDRRTEAFTVPRQAPGDPDSPCAAAVTALAESADGALWVGTFTGGLCRVAPDRRSAQRIVTLAHDGRPVDRIYALRLDAEGVPWAQLGSAMLYPGASPFCRIDIAARTCSFLPARRFVRRIDTSLVVTGMALPLVVHRIRADGSATPVGRYPLAVAPSVAIAQNILALPDGRLWLATEGRGILTVDLATGREQLLEPDPDVPRSLGGSTVNALFRDRQGTIWIGTRQGLDRWQPPDAAPFRVFRRGDPERGGLSADPVNGILEARDGTLWIATTDGLNRIDPATGRVEVLRRPDDGPHANTFWTLHEARDGTLWMGSKRRGLFRLAPGSRRIERVPITSRPEGTTLQVRSITEDREGWMWVGLGTGFAVRPAGGSWHEFGLVGPSPSPLPSPRVNVFYEDRRGTLWAGTDEGLCRLTERTTVEALAFRCYRHDRRDLATLGANVVWSLAEDGRGRLWAGTVGGGLARYAPETDAFVRLTTRAGLPNNTVYGLVADREGVLWATTNAGLARIGDDGGVSVFTTADGLPGDEFDFMAYDIGPSGTVRVGGPSGVAAFEPARLAVPPVAAPVAFTGVRVFDRRVPGLFASGDVLTLHHDENFFRLAFAALDLRSPERARYQYRLAGYETGWRKADAQAPEASYTGVPPGHYTFEVMADGSAAVTTLRVVIVPALWQRPEVRGGLVALVVLGLAGAGVVGRRRRVAEAALRSANAAELKRRVAEGRERERVRLARDLHDGPVQDLYHLGHDLDRLRLRRQPLEAEDLAEARERVTTVTTILRDVLAALRPPILPHLGLAVALESLARRGRLRQLDVTLDVDEAVADALPDDAQTAVYRVVQEALVNIDKHAGATCVQVTLADEAGGVRVTITDDGRGFTPPTHLLDLARAGRFGVVGASERVEVLGGRLEVASTLGQGTTVRAWIPRGPTSG